MSDAERETRDAEELRELIRSGPQTPGRDDAFLELVNQEPPNLTQTLRSLVTDPEIDRSMRLNAVTALGRTPLPGSLDGLRDALDVDDQVVVQRAVERLGKVGGPHELDALRGVRTGNATTHRALRASKCFLSYRHGLGTYRFDLPRAVVEAGDDAVALRTGGLIKALREHIDRHGVNVPMMAWDADDAWRIECPDVPTVVLLNRAMTGADMRSVSERQALVGVVAQPNPETAVFEPAFYLVTDPAGRGAFHLFGVRESGVVALYGRGMVDDDIQVEVGATETPHVHPVDIRAVYHPDRSTLRFDAARIAPRLSARQLARRQHPRPA
jgi:hypothetical protein